MTKSDQTCCLIFKALGDENRLKILKLLKKEELCVSDICKRFDITQPSVSHHLDILKRADLVTTRKSGREVYYSFNRDCLFECCGKQLSVLGLQVLRD